jgi:thiol-disulfide isomerase/thioredoxin
MIELESLEQYNTIISQAKDLIVLCFYNDMCTPCNKVTPLLEDTEERYSPSVTFLKAHPRKVFQIFAKYQIPCVPSVLLISKDEYNSSQEPIVRARLVHQDITRDNLIGLISEYKKNITLK